jgi:hypothetical protein
MIASAALQLAWSRYFSDLAAETGDAEMALAASRLADASGQNLAKAHEYCAKARHARRHRARATRSPPSWSSHDPRPPWLRRGDECSLRRT